MKVKKQAKVKTRNQSANVQKGQAGIVVKNQKQILTKQADGQTNKTSSIIIGVLVTRLRKMINVLTVKQSAGWDLSNH